MSRLLENQVHFLELLRTAKKDQRKSLLKTINKLQLKALSEIAHNVIKGTIVLSSDDKIKLRGYKKILTTLGRKSSEFASTWVDCRRTSFERRKNMDKMILIPYDRYQKLCKRQTGEGTESSKKSNLGSTKKSKLGPPGMPAKNDKTWISL